MLPMTQKANNQPRKPPEDLRRTTSVIRTCMEVATIDILLLLTSPRPIEGKHYFFSTLLPPWKQLPWRRWLTHESVLISSSHQPNSSMEALPGKASTYGRELAVVFFHEESGSGKFHGEEANTFNFRGSRMEVFTLERNQLQFFRGCWVTLPWKSRSFHGGKNQPFPWKL